MRRRSRPARTTPGFFSSARTFALPAGPRVDPAGLGGYGIDLRAKADNAYWPPRRLWALDRLHVFTTQFGLGCHERWLAGEGERWLRIALAAGRHLVAAQEPGGTWLHRADMPHTFPLRAPWVSAMAQGQAASLLVRLHAVTGDAALAEAARRALGPLRLPSADRGVRVELGRGPWFEEYPTDPPSYVLNGAIFALWGVRDVAVALGDAAAARDFEAGVDALAATLERFDTGGWSLYSLYPHPLGNPASSFYHALHVSQLEVLHRLAPRPELAAIRDRWAAYARSAACRRRAFAAKAAFRIVVRRPRHPWGRAR